MVVSAWRRPTSGKTIEKMTIVVGILVALHLNCWLHSVQLSLKEKACRAGSIYGPFSAESYIASSVASAAAEKQLQRGDH